MKYCLYFFVFIFIGCTSQNNLQITTQYDKYGAQDSNGKIFIKHQYEMIYPFDERGFAKVIGFRGKYGVIDMQDRIVVDIIYDYIGEFENGKAKIILNAKEGWIDFNYKVIEKP